MPPLQRRARGSGGIFHGPRGWRYRIRQRGKDIYGPFVDFRSDASEGLDKYLEEHGNGVIPPKPRGAIPGSKQDMSSWDPPHVARDRVQREITEGKRCQRCWLLLPCDH